ERARMLFQIAECYRFTEDASQAESWYKKAIAAGYDDNAAILYMADAIRIQGRYDEALVEYNKFLKAAPGDKRGESGAKACEKALVWTKEPTRYEVNNEVLLNSKQYDFSPLFIDKKNEEIMFTSTREGSVGTAVDDRSGENFSDLYTSKRDKKGKWGVPGPVAEPVNTGAHEGSASMNARKNSLYFTRCSKEKKKIMGCQIYKAKRQGKNWGEPELIDLGLNDTVRIGHPFVMNKEQTLIFAANGLPGGYGGRDLWYTTYNKKERAWGAPVNLGSEVNTSDDEMFPFVRQNGDLYFASNGHVGMGGLDIFHAKKTGEMLWGDAQNMKSPINSPANDFGLIFEGDKNRGFFSSSREGGKGGDDVYSFFW
ncbi:MAG: tetratricopeptide repeat protein, partial [Bacteroidota bacterium]